VARDDARGVTNDAARANAEWCDLVARADGAPTTWSDEVWSCRRRTPPGYPDAVTLVPAVDAHEMLAAIDGSPGCSVKDSFAALDLHRAGFEVLFHAQWIVAAPAAGIDPRGGGWTVAADPLADLPAHLPVAADLHRLPPTVLADPMVSTLVATRGGAVVGTAIAHRAASMVGLTHVTVTTDDDDRVGWVGLLARLRLLHPGLAVAGYESGAAFADAIAAGFRPCGPLRVWHRPGEGRLMSTNTDVHR
jgi:hypothetical protein